MCAFEHKDKVLFGCVQSLHHASMTIALGTGFYVAIK